jgi:hypothetical protein
MSNASDPASSAAAREPGGDAVVVLSEEDPEGTRCVDVFVRPDGSFGFEEFRRDAEDGGRWSRVGAYGRLRYAGLDEARAAARRAVRWFSRTAEGE